MDNTLFSLNDFKTWLENYNQQKKNQQNFGVQNIPGRVFRKTIDLSTAGVLENTGIPFNGLQVEKIYIAATGISADGSVKLIFDRAMSDSQFNYKVLKENDSFTTGFSIAKGFLSWDAQAGMKADIVFFNDIDYRSGSQKTSITGTLTANVQNYPNPTNIVVSATGASYTVPVGKVAKAKLLVRGNGSFAINGTTVLDGFDATASWSVLSTSSLSKGGASAGGDTLNVDTLKNTNNGAAYVSTTASNRAYNSVVMELNLPAGTTVLGTAGTGAARYVIEEYNV